MASIHKQPGRPFYFCAFTKADGARVFRSTKTANKKQALEICRAWSSAANHARTGHLTPERAREVIAAGVADVFAAANREAMPSATMRAWCERWLAAKEIETEPATHARYSSIMASFVESLGKAADRDISTLRPDAIARFRDSEAKSRARATANLSLKVLRMALGNAVRHGLLTANPAEKVDVLKARGEGRRRNFTAAEIRRVLYSTDENPEWRGLVLFGLYTGQRLGDLARLTWRAVNLESREVAFVARKTGRRILLPLLPPLLDYLATLPAGDDPDAPLFPRSAKATHTGTLSNRFREILVAAGLAEPSTHKSTGKGRDSGRESAELSFHSLRHSAVTFLKAAGVTEALAMAIVGHESAAISRGYTHLATDDLRREMEKMPDVTKAAA